jgi:hypothetical protein
LKKVAKSKKLGRLLEWGGHIVYEAGVELECEDCGGTIKIGEYFIRKMLKGRGRHRTYPVCRRCV